jgi:outer membrane protein assembly factor BamD (BamD/ComL family)
MPSPAAATAQPAPSARLSERSAKATSSGPSKRSPEREALDLAADGSYEEAAARYEALASMHPEDPTFKEAARILRVRAGHVH